MVKYKGWTKEDIKTVKAFKKFFKKQVLKHVKSGGCFCVMADCPCGYCIIDDLEEILKENKK